MITTTEIQMGRVIRIGRGWADVVIEGKIRRISVRPDLLVRAGSYLRIINEHAVGLLPSNPNYPVKHLQ